MENLSRLKLLVQDKIDLIKNKTVLILGIGGVGSYTLESIVRSGISKVIIVDGDTFEESNINRQLMATTKTVGLKKVDVYESRIKEINPNLEVIKINEFIDETNIDKIFDYDIDYAVDACDTVNTKYLFIKKCLDNNIKFISVMGMGNKLDPSKIEITELKKTEYDPLAKKLRNMLKDENRKIMVVSSKEEPIKNKENIISSNAFVPAVAGLFASSYVINDIIKGDL